MHRAGLHALRLGLGAPRRPVGHFDDAAAAARQKDEHGEADGMETHATHSLVKMRAIRLMRLQRCAVEIR